MSQDGRGQRIPIGIKGDGIKMIPVSCGSEVYGGPGGVDFRRCRLGHYHCLNCGGVARRYGRTYSCIDNCKVGT